MASLGNARRRSRCGRIPSDVNMADSATIQIRQVSFTYPGETRPALDRVTATFAPGAVSLLTGPLGSGCSTLLLAAAGLVPHVTGGQLSGTVTTLDVDPASLAGRRALAGRIGILLPTPWTQLSGMASTVA